MLMKSPGTRIVRAVVVWFVALALFATACGGGDAAESASVDSESVDAPVVAEADSSETESADSESAASSPPIGFVNEDAEDEAVSEAAGAAPNDAAAFGGADIAEVDLVIVSGDALAGFDSSVTPDPAIGTASPLFEATNLADGARITLPGDGGAVIGFFAHWCPHCQAELPELIDWLDTGALPEGTTFIAVSTAVSDERDNYPPSQWFNNEGWTGQAVADDAQASLLATFGFSGFPAFVAVDADGIVVDRIGGNVGVAGFDRLAAALAE